MKEPTNITVKIFESFSYHSKIYKPAIMFCFNGDERYPFYMLPKEDGTFMGVRGQGHIRGGTLAWIEMIFKKRDYNDFEKIVQNFRNREGTVIVQDGIYR